MAGWELDPSLTGALTVGSVRLTFIGRTQGPETGDPLAGASPGAQRGEGPPDLGHSRMDWQAGRLGGGGWTGRARCWGERPCLHQPASSGHGHGVKGSRHCLHMSPCARSHAGHRWAAWRCSQGHLNTLFEPGKLLDSPPRPQPRCHPSQIPLSWDRPRSAPHPRGDTPGDTLGTPRKGPFCCAVIRAARMTIPWGVNGSGGEG